MTVEDLSAGQTLFHVGFSEGRLFASLTETSDPSSHERQGGLPLSIVLIFAVPFLIAIVAFVSFRFFGANNVQNEVIVEDAREVIAMTPLTDGGFIYGERTTGRIFSVDETGTAGPEPIAELDVSSDGEGGLLGLASREDGKLFAAYTDERGFLMVSALDDGGAPRPIWEGPQGVATGNGGHITFDPNGDLVIGIGDLEQPDLIDDVSTLNGKLLRLDPEGDESQLPAVISGSWNDPSAFTFTPGGELWVADEGRGDSSDRVARGDLGDGPERVAGLRDAFGPKGLAAIDDETLALCGETNGELAVLKIDARGIPYTLGSFPTLATDCALGVIALEDGRLVYSTGTDLRAASASDL